MWPVPSKDIRSKSISQPGKHVSKKSVMAICCPVQIKSWGIRSSDSSRESWNLIFEKSSEFWVMLIKLLKHSGTKSKNYVDSWMLASAVLWGPRLPVVKCDASVVELSFHYFLQWSPRSSVASSYSRSCLPPFQAHWTSQTHSHLGNFARVVLLALNGLPPDISTSKSVPEVQMSLSQ